ncbi:unnamed protein product [Cladocopium goreaui]|uniref:Uncharacterized protein n=1 Tax=Cladocopium goreaui TaxID=2562237 RepID=A0A9P1D656_9DINO|nr:unnamed protein product [Cladocopium goreaui]
MMFTRVLMGFECFDPSPISCIAIQNRSWSLPRLQLNVVSYGAAIAACGGYGGRWAAALMLFDQLSPQSLQPNLVTFNGYLSALQKAARWEQALSPELGSEMGPLDVPAYGAQVAACAAARSWMQVAALLRELRKCQLQADSWMKQWTVYSLARGQIHSSSMATPQARVPVTSREDGPLYRPASEALDVLRADDLATWRDAKTGRNGGRGEEQQLSESQARDGDALYVNMREQIDKKAIQKRSEQLGLHFLEAEKPNRHTIFVDEDDLEEPQKPGAVNRGCMVDADEVTSFFNSQEAQGERLVGAAMSQSDFDVAGYFETHPALLKRKANRLRLKQLQTKEIKAVEDAMGPGDDDFLRVVKDRFSP